MRRLARLYLRFFLALLAGLVAAFVGAFPAVIAAGSTRMHRVDMGTVWFGLVPAVALGAVAFWAAGRLGSLGASLPRVALAAAGAAACVAAALLRLAARVPWLTGDGAFLIVFVALATLGFLPFAWATDPQGRSFRDDLPWRGRA